MRHNFQGVFFYAMQGAFFGLLYDRITALALRGPVVKVQHHVLAGGMSGVLSGAPFLLITVRNFYGQPGVIIPTALSHQMTIQLLYVAFGYLLLGAGVGLLIGMSTKAKQQRLA
jgi:hypothetical protein